MTDKINPSVLKQYLNNVELTNINTGDKLHLKKTTENINKNLTSLNKIENELLDGKHASDKGLLVMSKAGNVHSQIINEMSRDKNVKDSRSDIMNRIWDSISKYTDELKELTKWTQGGESLFHTALQDMFDELKKKGAKSGTSLEDLFQLALMEYMSHPDYPKLDKDTISAIQHFLESTGSGSHGYHESHYKDFYAGQVTGLFNKLFKNAPKGSLANQILSYLQGEAGAPKSLVDQFNNNYGKSSTGFALDDDYDTSNGLSPMLRMAILSTYLEKYPNMSKKDMQLFLNGSLDDINKYVLKNPDLSKYKSALDFMFKNDVTGDKDNNAGWQGFYDPNSGHWVVDYIGNGLNLDYFKTLYEKLPSRKLTDDELKQVNRIGDEVKMINQILKYMIQLWKDSLSKIAANI